MHNNKHNKELNQYNNNKHNHKLYMYNNLYIKNKQMKNNMKVHNK